jgi:hypothetical protein
LSAASKKVASQLIKFVALFMDFSGVLMAVD